MKFGDWVLFEKSKDHPSGGCLLPGIAIILPWKEPLFQKNAVKCKKRWSQSSLISKDDTDMICVTRIKRRAWSSSITYPSDQNLDRWWCRGSGRDSGSVCSPDGEKLHDAWWQCLQNQDFFLLSSLCLAASLSSSFVKTQSNFFTHRQTVTRERLVMFCICGLDKPIRIR